LRIKGTVFLCAPFVLSSGLAYAQTITGSITGVVTDPTGSVIPGAR
jgi:hypothetical protein